MAGVYTVIVVATLWWTSSVTSVTIYDKYVVRFEAVSLSCSEPARTAMFYRDVLNFLPISASAQTLHTPDRIGFQLPDKRKLLFERTAQHGPVSEHPAVVLRVRNGFERLHRELRDRLSRFLAEHPPAGGHTVRVQPAVSPIHSQPWGEEFSVDDEDGNTFIFLQPKRRSGTRF